ncbi:E3 ubiquitin-protein ligase RNF4-like [Ananas comosus]|uniref:E3 ubiquitin-protein ligase RNF4-like n=1 Tax=Ananas comosus TaxID=4615 RepID=A0A6P5EZ73_ANACO|nr:E3 ubiquitin-protein ligase RNF4-like [Ananas comosus]XP_020088812.1 E3 ubiquitin-protein ligase RNF4-like [Ananas comosus]
MNNERNKVVYDLDLNSPPADSQEGNLTSQDDAVSAATSGAVNSHPLPNIGSYCTPIIVDSDEAEMLSVPTGFPQMRNPSTSSMMTIVFDEDVEIINPRQSVNVTKDPPATSPLFTDNKCESVPPNTTLMNCGHLQDTDAARSPKKRNVTRPTQEPAKVVSNEPNDEPVKVVPKKDKEPEKMPDTEPLNKPIEEPAKKPNSEPANKFPTMTCPICLHPLVKASSTICGHVFCTGCIKEAIRAFKKCPTCRTKLTIKNVHPIFLPR